MTKKILYSFIMLLVLCACKEDTSVDPTLMPAATQSGKNTLGCLIDGWVYTGGRFGKPQATSSADEKGNYILIRTQVDVFTALEFILVNPAENTECTYTHVLFGGEKLEDGKAFITRKDGTILSGTFSGARIKEGRFDVRYTEEKNNGGGIAY